MPAYTTVFFDLDHTLWDYETSSRETLLELYDHYNLLACGVPGFEPFLQTFREVNKALWHQYDHGHITSEVIRNERFRQILNHFNAYEAALSENLSTDYLQHCPRKGNLMPGALDALEHLQQHYLLCVITNGFDDIQRIKMEAGNIMHYFRHIITSQQAGYKKPAKEIFQFALQASGAQASHAIMIGDNLLTDIAGAKNASIDTVFFNPDGIRHEETVNHEIHHLNQLCKLL